MQTVQRPQFTTEVPASWILQLPALPPKSEPGKHLRPGHGEDALLHPKPQWQRARESRQAFSSPVEPSRGTSLPHAFLGVSEEPRPESLQDQAARTGTATAAMTVIHQRGCERVQQQGRQEMHRQIYTHLGTWIHSCSMVRATSPNHAAKPRGTAAGLWSQLLSHI